MLTFLEVQDAYFEARRQAIDSPSEATKRQWEEAEKQYQTYIEDVDALREELCNLLRQHQLDEKNCLIVPLTFGHASNDLTFWTIAIETAKQMAGLPTTKRWIH